VISAGHARALLGLADRQAQEELAARVVAEGLSVRATEELVSVADASRAPRSRARSSSAKISAPALGELAGNLSDELDTHVRVDLGRRKGKITIEFGSIDDLERIVAIIAPKLATRRG
jgi:ParB family transcriptional regulator, chromosome partitioning protein